MPSCSRVVPRVTAIASAAARQAASTAPIPAVQRIREVRRRSSSDGLGAGSWSPIIRPPMLCTPAADAPGRNRTCDLALRRRALYPLSYRRGACLVYRRGAERPDRLPASWPRRSRSRAGRRTRRTSSRSRSGTGTCPGSARRRRSSATTSRPSRRSRTWRASAGELGDDPFALEEVMRRLPAERVRGAGGDRRGAARPLREAARRAGLAAARARAARPADLVDDRARRPRRDGARRRRRRTRAGGSGG